HLKSLTLDSDSEADFVYESEHLSIYPEVEDVVKQVTLGMLNYSKYKDDLKGASCKILFSDYLKSCVPTNYWTITALTDVMERNEALALYKEYVDYRTDILMKSRLARIETLEEYYASASVGGAGPHDVTYAILEGGIGVARFDRCMWHEIQKEFGDGEIAYTNSCFYDFYAITVCNENFELTRTKTLMQGDKYCDFCWHDKRIDKTMEHPSEEFFESL
ncbi:MAG: L-2-amino-thiazoline-4-carboxylic acid hydrolase, partial [Candidatus Thorarchaeota archaeon]